MRVQIIPVCLAVALMASGCDDKSTPPAVDGGVPAGPAQVLTTLKDEKPYILMDMSPELGTFKSLQGTERETFLLRRAVKAVHEHGLKETKFTGKDSFVVRMVLVEGKDEYNRPKWGSAKEIAIMETNRASAESITPESLGNLAEDKLRSAFTSSSFAK